ncbi:MAG: RNA polymerase sigma factor [Gammaproteobacteria bacterium]|nr:RNA polymerase sigma factor [Gammaproteobacteria bacterium]
MIFPGFKRQLAQHRDRMYRLAYSWCGDAMLADDLIQDALSRAISKKDQLKDHAKLEQWLYRILHNSWMEYLRRNRPATDLDTVQIVDELSPEVDFTKLQIVDAVRFAIGQLPVGQRQVITLVDLEEFTYNEVAEILEIPVGTVMSRLSRARKSLKESLFHLKAVPMERQPLLRRVK